MRILSAILGAALILLAACTAPGDDASGPEAPTDPDPARTSMEYLGAVTGLSVDGTGVSPDQAGAVHRGFYVQQDTQVLEIHVTASGGSLTVTAYPHGCGDDACRHVFTADPEGHLALEDPAPGAWVVDLRAGATSAGEIAYNMTVALDGPVRAVVEETHDGTVTAAHLGAIRISPDQLGDVYREFWVPEGTTDLHFRFDADDEAYVVLGQAGPEGRDSASESGNDTTDGQLEVHEADPAPGVWYFIVFHESDGPGLTEISYDARIVKHMMP